MQPDYKDVGRFGVSRESFEKLEIYHALLLKWQKAINLVSPSTIKNAWQRHFIDSMQVSQYVSRESSLLYDLGSGAGFPGMVLAILNPDIDVHFIESDDRKCQFLRTVSRETQTPVNIHVARIEAVADLPSPCLVTARALADLPALLGFVAGWAVQNPSLNCLFLKGSGAAQEVEVAREFYDFTLQSFPSVTNSDAQILNLSGISRKSGA